MNAFDEARQRLEHSGYGIAQMHRPFTELFPVSGAAISTLGSFLGSETLAASDAQAARIDELQFDLGEGPCWDAMNLAKPVVEPDVRQSRHAWPAFSEAIAREDVRSLLAFPLVVGPLRIGAVDLYSVEPIDLDEKQTRQAAELAGLVSREVLRNAIETAGELDRTSPFSRRTIHQATGMVLAQLDLTPAEALLVIQGHAFGASQSVMKTAQQIVDGELDFTDQGGES